jgi:hypothetical protein
MENFVGIGAAANGGKVTTSSRPAASGDGCILGPFSLAAAIWG